MVKPGVFVCNGCEKVLWFIETAEGPQCYEHSTVLPIIEKICNVIAKEVGIDKRVIGENISQIDDISLGLLDYIHVILGFEEDIGFGFSSTEEVENVLVTNIGRLSQAIAFLLRRRMMRK